MKITPEELRATCAEAQAAHYTTLEETKEFAINEVLREVNILSRSGGRFLTLEQEWFEDNDVPDWETEEVMNYLNDELTKEGFICEIIDDSFEISWSTKKQDTKEYDLS